MPKLLNKKKVQDQNVPQESIANNNTVKPDKAKPNKSTIKNKIIEKFDEAMAKVEEKGRKPRSATARVTMTDNERVRLVNFIEAACKFELIPPARRVYFDSLLKLMKDKNTNPSRAQMERLKTALDLTTLRDFPNIK